MSAPASPNLTPISALESCGWLTASLVAGGELVIKETVVRNLADAPYMPGRKVFEMRKGKRWVEGITSTDRINLPQCSFYQGRFEGSLLYIELSRSDAEALLRQGMSQLVRDQLAILEATLASLEVGTFS